MKNILIACVFLILSINIFGQTQTTKINPTEIVLANKIIPIDHSVYAFIDLFEATGIFGFLPQSRPYTKIQVINLLNTIVEHGNLSSKELVTTNQYIQDLQRPMNGIVIKDEKFKENYAIVGASANVGGRYASGDHATWATENLMEGFVGAEIGNNITAFAGVGVTVDRLSPDMFYEGYVSDGAVHQPYIELGYAFHPYQFTYEGMWAHVELSADSGEGAPIKNSGEPTSAFLYHAELSGSWMDGAITMSYHNQQRSWGYGDDNLNLSARARRFPGIDFKVTPLPWFKYSFLTGSLFHYGSQKSGYKENIYGYDLGEVQRLFSLHILEIDMGKHMQFTYTGGNLWSKRLELAYLMPFALPHLTQIDIGDHDNLSMSVNLATIFPQWGKNWLCFFIDEMSFFEMSDWFRQPRNRYAWQFGWNTALPSKLIPTTQLQFSYTRLTPFVYTHYPETDFNEMTEGRPTDMTYTNDGANLGFYLPPNSSELKVDFINMCVPDLYIKLKNRYIIHGTNDLNGDQYQIFGDIYRHQYGNVTDYPLTDFKNDGIYDYTWFSELNFEKKIRSTPGIRYFRILGSLGYSKTWWDSNDSGIEAPESSSMVSASFSLIIDM